MGQLARVVDAGIKKVVTRELNSALPFLQQQGKASSLNGKAEVIDLNSDGTANVKFNGQTIENVQLAGRPVGPGSIVILQSGVRIVN
jgi:hypothetical protein